jgi:hypothetical protein
MRLPITTAALLLLLCATAQGYRKPSYEDVTSVPAVIDFPSLPSEAGSTKQFTTTTPVSIVGRPTLLNSKGGDVLGKILKARVTLSSNPDGSVHLVFDRVSVSGEHEGDSQNGYATGEFQNTVVGPNRGGLSWTIEIYDATNAQAIYRWEDPTREEIKCGASLSRSSSTVISADVFQRAAKVRATAAPAEWTHC